MAPPFWSTVSAEKNLDTFPFPRKKNEGKGKFILLSAPQIVKRGKIEGGVVHKWYSRLFFHSVANWHIP